MYAQTARRACRLACKNGQQCWRKSARKETFQTRPYDRSGLARSHHVLPGVEDGSGSEVALPLPTHRPQAGDALLPQGSTLRAKAPNTIRKAHALDAEALVPQRRLEDQDQESQEALPLRCPPAGL